MTNRRFVAVLPRDEVESRSPPGDQRSAHLVRRSAVSLVTLPLARSTNMTSVPFRAAMTPPGSAPRRLPHARSAPSTLNVVVDVIGFIELYH